MENKEDLSQIKSKTRLAVYWDFFNKLSTQGMSFLISIVLARLLSPAEFGIIALPMVFLAIAQCFVNSGLTAALIRKSEVSEEDLNTAFFFSLGVGILFYGILYISSPLIADFYNVPILSDLLKVSALSTIFTPLQSVHFVLLNRDLNYKTPAIISLVSVIVTGSVGIYLAYMGLGVWALVFQGVSGSIVSTIMVWLMVKWKPNFHLSYKSFQYMFGFGSKMLLSSLFDTIHDNIYPIVIGKFYSPSDLGLYNRSQGYAQLPFKQINGMLEGISFPVLSKLQGDEEQLSSSFRRFLKLSIFVLCPIMFGLSALAYPLIILLITDKWVACVPLLEVLCFAIFLWPVQSLNFSLLKVKGRSDLLLKLNLGIKLLGIIVMCFTVPNGIMAIGYGSIVHVILAVLWITYYTGKISSVSMYSQIREISSIVLLGGSMYILIKVVVFFITPLITQLLVGTLVGTIYYLVMAYFLKFPELQDIKYLLKM